MIPAAISRQKLRQQRTWFALFALVAAIGIVRGVVAQPGFTDAYYHFNAAVRLVNGEGLTDPYLWNYINAPDTLPPRESVPSHTYWMPLTSLAAAVGMWLWNAPGDYAAAQSLFVLMLAGTACIGFWLGARLGGSLRHAWAAGLVTLFSGFFTRFWGATDTFGPYAVAGSLCLVWCGLGCIALENERVDQKSTRLWFGLAGTAAGAGHLARADGLLLLIVLWLVILWPFGQKPASALVRLWCVAASTLGYVVVMTPWFIRNLNITGSILPLGGFQAAWFTEYNDLFSYPPDATPAGLFADGIGLLISSRWTALLNNFGTFVAVEGLVVMAPLMVMGLWNRRKSGFLRGFWIYALGVHLAMTFVFPFPGYRGGLFHSAAALIPWWAALGIVGLDDVVDWAAKRRRTWKPRTAKQVFSAALVVLAVIFSASIARSGRVSESTPVLYKTLQETLPSDARVMVNDPAAFYYFTGLSGVVLPNEPPDRLPEIARRFFVTHLLIQYQESAQGRAYAVPSPLIFDLETPPDFLIPVEVTLPNARLYVFATR